MKTSSRDQGPNGRCRFGQKTFAGVRGNGRDAPTTVAGWLSRERQGSTQTGPSLRVRRPWIAVFFGKFRRACIGEHRWLGSVGLAAAVGSVFCSRYNLIHSEVSYWI